MLNLEDIIKILKKAMRPLRHRVNNMVLMGKLLLLGDEKTPSAQVVTVNDEVLDNVKFFQDYGINSRPRKQSQVLLLKVQGNPGNVIAVKIFDRDLRFKCLKDGEVAVSDDSGNYIHLKNGGNIDVVAPETLNVQAKVINTNGKNIVVNADIVTVNATTTTINGKTNLAGGGAGLARLGDTVEVDPLTHKGIITSASTEATAG